MSFVEFTDSLPSAGVIFRRFFRVFVPNRANYGTSFSAVFILPH